VRRFGLLLAALLAACSGLDEGEAGVVGLELRVPGPDSVEIGESIQLAARPLNKDGDSVGAAVTWLSADPTATIDAATGVLSGVSAGTARVQASVGALDSPLLTFAVVAPADALVLTTDSVVALAAGVTTSPPLGVRLVNAAAGPLPNRSVIYAVTLPDPTAAPSPVVLLNDITADTVLTGTDSTATNTLALVVGASPPDSAIVTVRAVHIRGEDVAGSGQRFIVRFAAP
jgi:hypothetical protein